MLAFVSRWCGIHRERFFSWYLLYRFIIQGPALNRKHLSGKLLKTNDQFHTHRTEDDDEQSRQEEQHHRNG